MLDSRDPTEFGDPIAAAGGEVAGYRPVSRLAVVALVLGGLSALALVSPFFLVVPLLALALAAAALRDVDRDGARKVGRLAALAAVALAAGFCGQAVSALLTARSIAATRAALAADMFLAAVRDGRLADAEAMCGAEARQCVERLSDCLDGAERQRPIAGEVPGAWVVRLTGRGSGRCVARLVLEPAIALQQRTTVERWLVVACDVTPGDALRPSAR